MTENVQSPTKYRLRLVFAKKKLVKYISHLDLALTWERALRRARIPLAYSQGFNPRPKMQFASGLPLGTTGSREIMDILTTKALGPDEVLQQTRQALPSGIELVDVHEIPLKDPSLQQLVRQAEYRVLVETDRSPEQLANRVGELLAADAIMQSRRRRKKIEEFDLRPWLHELELRSVVDGDALLHMRVTAGQFGNLRPEAVLKALDLADNWAEIERTRLIFEGDVLA